MKVFSWNKKSQVFLGTIVFLVIWEFIAIKINKDIYLPKIEDVLISMIEIIKSPEFIKNSISTLYRTIVSFTIALILSVILGVLSFMYPFLKNLLAPLNSIGKTIPTMILVLLALIWFDKDKAPFVVGFAIVFPILYEGIYNSLKDIDKKIITASSIYDDIEQDFPNGYHPTDYNKPLGKITVRRAVESSQNIPFVEIMQQLQPQNSIKYLIAIWSAENCKSNT